MMEEMMDDDNYEKQQEDKYEEDKKNFSAAAQGLENGIKRDRGCTDILCLLIFIASIGAMIFCAIYGNKHGNLAKLLAPLDGDDRFCGFKDITKSAVPYDFTGYNRLFLADLSPSKPKDIFEKGVCVKACPKRGTVLKKDTDFKSSSHFSDATWTVQYDTKEVLGYCFPTGLKTLATNPNFKDFEEHWEAAKKEFLNNPIGKYFNDLYLASNAIYISFGMSIIYSFIFIYLMSFFAEPIAWACVVLVQLGLLGGSVFCWIQRTELQETEAALLKQVDAKNPLVTQNVTNQKYCLAGVIVLGILAVLFLTCICCGFKSLKLAIDVIDASADFLATTKRIILVPVLYFFISVIIFMSWVFAFMNVAAMNKMTPDTSIIPQMKDLQWTDKKIKLMALFMLFCLLWLMAWIKYTCKFICMVSAATYYFNSDSATEGSAEVGLGFKFAYFNHLGSLAVGSFIIAVIQMIRILFLYFAKKAAQAGGDNKFSQFIIACGDCCLRCIERVCDYINTAAYSYMAVSGDNFCMSAWNGFLLNAKHLMKFAFANTIAKVFIFLGKLGIVVANVFSCWGIMKFITHDIKEISSKLGPFAVVAVVSYITASLFLGLFETAVMALMTSLAIDMDLHNGEPKWGPPTFHDSINKMDKDKVAEMQDNEATMD